MKWRIAGKKLNEHLVYQRLEELKQDGPTGIMLIGADGALKGQIISKLWNNLSSVAYLHPVGGASMDLENGHFVVNNPFGNLAVEHSYRDKYIADFREAGAKHVALIWVKYPDEPGWTNSTGRAEDQILRDNPPEEDVDLFIEVEKKLGCV